MRWPCRSRRSGRASTEAAFAVLWWAHIALVAAFLVYLPFSKHLHIVTSFFNVYFRKLAPRGELPAMDLEDETATFGLRTLQDLGWKDLLDGFTCTECGRCQAACPANATGKPLNPKALHHGHPRDGGRGRARDRPHPELAARAARRTGWSTPRPTPSRLADPIVDAAIPYDAVWDCVTCGACVEACPVLIEHVDKIVGLRRNLVLEDSRFPGELTAAFTNMERAGNPWGQPKATRTDWTKGLPFEVPTVAELAAADRLGEVDVLYWVGCAAAFDERNRRVARAFATCLDAAGVRFAILGQEESCTGDPARRMGNDYVWQMLAAANIETLDRYALRSIVTACPHCFNSIGNEYGQLGGRYEVVHHSVFLRRLLAEGRLRTIDADGSDPAAARTVTFHDSCYMARYNDVVAQPRDVLAAVPGARAASRWSATARTAFCCGAGGGRMWMEETRGTRINAERTRQALATGAGTVATDCPFCMTMMRDGLASAEGNAAGVVSAVDIAELLAETVDPTRSGGRQLPGAPVTPTTPAAAYRLTDEQRELRDAVREIARERVAPRAAEIDRTAEFPWDLKELLASQDILGLPYPAEYGGLGADLLTTCLAIEELSEACATTGLILAVHELAALPILLAGSDEQKARWLPDLAAGASSSPSP